MQHKWQALRFMKHKGTKKPAEAGFYFWMLMVGLFRKIGTILLLFLLFLRNTGIF